MPQFFLNKRLIILLVSMIILVALIGFSIRDRKQLTWPEQFMKDTTGFVQSLVSKPANYVAGFFENLNDLQNTYNENKELKKRVDKIASLEAEVQLLEKENKKLNDVLGKKETLRDYDPTQATVIARNPDRWNEQVIINKGSVNGIEKKMAVVTASGLIGKVNSVNKFTSTVQLLSANDSKNRISAVILGGEQEVHGLIMGYDEKKKLLLLKQIPADAKVAKKQNVVTSGLGGIFPEGLPIGKVVKVVPDEYGLTQTAYIKPGADFYDIENVMVIQRKMAQPQSSDMVDDKGEEL
ncbi:rod shape-determining protein MreC [Bacillus sp. 1NLA3E]|uniref:rod shape-determining protein MreC n=1 Tax=Bacillus sp. 1NLA3E TaxID=666686 RepID=UPI000247EB1A|nr:rod shape-determining protein MreC [Bacillus sp. 1NLA3E]AGK55079.1 rod shape-determining protein MreC [Bacillus sp. 1NLA3E]